jgi:hypothetical protein
MVALACASSGSPLPRGAPPLAPGSTPEPVRFEVIVPGMRLDVRQRLVRLLTDSLFHVNPADGGSVTAYNLDRLVKVRVDLTPVSKDSVRVGLTGETYLGDSTRRDSISGLPERWRLITSTDGGTTVLRHLARAVLVMRERPDDPDDKPGRDPDTGAQGSTSDPRVTAMLAGRLVGQTVDVCRSPSVPFGWLILYWYFDPSRCTGLRDTRYRDEPNVMRIEREW